MKTRRASQNPKITQGLAALRDWVSDEIYDDLLRLAAMVSNEKEELAVLGAIMVIAHTIQVQRAALGKKKPMTRAERRAARKGGG